MSKAKKPAPATAPAGTFADEFHRRLDTIEERAKACGLTLTHICRDSGIARATPDRWRDKLPLTIALIDKMEAVVAAAERTQAKPAA